MYFKKMFLSFVLFTFLFYGHLNAQNTNIKTTFQGRVLNKENEKISQAQIDIFLKDSLLGSAVSDIDGYFNFSTLMNIDSFKINVQHIEYENQMLELNKEEGADVKIILSRKSKQQAEVVIKSSRKKESIQAAIEFQKNIPLVAQVVGADFIKRLPDRNTAEVLKRIPGASIQDGKYIILRGLSDRYNQVMLNGVLMSSTEPDRKVFSLDIFPSSTIENIVIYKTFAPENSAEGAGGIASIETKEAPSKSFLSVQISSGFNSQTFNEDFLINKTSNAFAFLGFDDTRNLPTNFPNKDAFFKLNDKQKNEYAKQMYDNWTTEKLSLPLFYNTQISGGKTFALGNNKKIGFIYSLIYSQRNIKQFFERSIYIFPSLDKAELVIDNDNNRYAQTNLLASLLNTSFYLNANNKFSFKNIFSNQTNNSTLTRIGTDQNNGNDNVKGTELNYNKNMFYSAQLSGEHNVPQWQIKINWVNSITLLNQIVPGQKRAKYIQNRDVENAPYLLEIGSSISPGTAFNFYSHLNDANYFSKIDVAKKMIWNDLPQQIKFGALYQYKSRAFVARPFGYKTTNEKLKTISQEILFTKNYLTSDLANLVFDELADKQYQYSAEAEVLASYLQFDNKFTDNLKIVWGARFEFFNQQLIGYNGNLKTVVPLQQSNFLPSFNLTYSVDQQTQIRLAYSQTVARPEFRETAPFTFFDFELNSSVAGYTKLKPTTIQNLDLRYEYYPDDEEIFNIGAFMKFFDKPIEQYFNVNGTSGSFNYLNAEEGVGYGFEVEWRKKLKMFPWLKNFSLWGNFSYLYNKVSSITSKIDRPMQGLSPYLINLGLQYEQKRMGLMANVLFNIIGRRILYVGSENIPNIWEAPRPLIDIQLSKKIFNNKASIGLNITDLLNQPAVFYHDVNNSGAYEKAFDVIAIRRINGTNITFQFVYNIF